MWLGEQITERGIGNGMSLLIFAGIVVGFPRRGHRQRAEDRQRRAGPPDRPPPGGHDGAGGGGHRVRRARPAPHHRAVREARGGTPHVRRPVHAPAPAREHQRRHPRDLRLLDHRLPADDRVLVGGRQPLDAVGVGAAPVGDAALQPPLRRLHHLLLLLLHRDRLQPGRRGREHAEVRRLRARHPPRQADRGVPRPHPRDASPSAAPSISRSSRSSRSSSSPGSRSPPSPSSVPAWTPSSPTTTSIG